MSELTLLPNEVSLNPSADCNLIRYITDQCQILAIVISHKFNNPGIHFFTPNHYSQQLAYMNHPVGKVIQPHVHNPVTREVCSTQEVLMIKRGRLRVDFYSNYQEYLESLILEAGDVILLVSGGHGFEALDPVEMIEIKQGPYLEGQDRTRFEGITTEQAKFVRQYEP